MYVITYYRMMMNTNCFVPSGSFVLLFWHLLAKYQVIWPNTSTQFLCFNLKICMYLYVLGGNDVRNKSNIWLSIGIASWHFKTRFEFTKAYHNIFPSLAICYPKYSFYYEFAIRNLKLRFFFIILWNKNYCNFNAYKVRGQDSTVFLE